MAEKKDQLAVNGDALYGQYRSTEAKPVYGGSYDAPLSQVYDQITTRPAFSYDVGSDPLYQLYKDRYTQNAKRSMKDTMGQAAGLTGGYGSSYGQAVGQQAYDETMRGLTDKIPELEERAFSRYQAEGERLADQYNRLMQLGQAEQAANQYNDQWAFTQQQYADEQKQYADKMTQQQYSNLSSAILTSGYQPSAEELAAAGMTAEQANALRQAWITANPQAAWMNGAISGEDFWRLTGVYPTGYTPAGAGGGGGYYGGGYNYDNAKGLSTGQIQQIQKALGVSVDGIWGPQTEAAYKAAEANATPQTKRSGANR